MGLCLNFSELREIETIKNNSPFTQDQTISEYIEGVVQRIEIMYGEKVGKRDSQKILNYLKKSVD